METPRRTGHFDDVDVDGLWDGGLETHYDEPLPTDELVLSVEEQLGYRLPDAYVELARIHNGGGLARSAFPMDEPTGWAEDHIQVTGIYAIGRTAKYSLCGPLGSQFMQEEWGYPAIGVAFADTPTAGHEQIMLDYRDCGPTGEPRVVYVDQEDDYRIVAVAPDFASFIAGLVDGDAFDDRAGQRERALVSVSHGTLSPFVTEALADGSIPESALRALGRAIVGDKGFLAVHADPGSRLLLDVMLYLYTRGHRVRDYEQFLRGTATDAICLESMLFGRSHPGGGYDFCTGGYAPRFVADWWAARIADGSLGEADGWRFTDEAERRIVDAMRDHDDP